MAFTNELKTLPHTHLGKAVAVIGLLALSPTPSARAYAASVNYELAKADFDAALPLWIIFSRDEDPGVVTVLAEDVPSLMQEPEVSQITLEQAAPLIDAFTNAMQRLHLKPRSH